MKLLPVPVQNLSIEFILVLEQIHVHVHSNKVSVFQFQRSKYQSADRVGMLYYELQNKKMLFVLLLKTKSSGNLFTLISNIVQVFIFCVPTSFLCSFFFCLQLIFHLTRKSTTRISDLFCEHT